MQIISTCKNWPVGIGRSLAQKEKIKNRRDVKIVKRYRREVVEIIGDTSYG
jgi:hypothetical protein